MKNFKNWEGGPGQKPLGIKEWVGMVGLVVGMGQSGKTQPGPEGPKQDLGGREEREGGPGLSLVRAVTEATCVLQLQPGNQPTSNTCIKVKSNHDKSGRMLRILGDIPFSMLGSSLL